MLERVKKYIRENHMLKTGDLVAAGVSGGADSIAMLHILKQLQTEFGFLLEAVHVHHGIRGEEADRDEKLVRDICREWEIPFRSYHYPVPELSKKWKLGEEETGRLVRKEAFSREREWLGFPEQSSDGEPQFLVALAHNRNDLAETMLHHLARGTGIRGLAGIRPCSGKIIRPVLCLERREIVNYLKEGEISYITDSTNLSDEYTRNRIRHHVLPVMEKEINSGAVEHMAETARVLAEAEEYLCKKGCELLEHCTQKKGYLLVESFFREAHIIQEYAVLEAFGRLAGKRKDFTALHVEQVLSLREKTTGRYIQLPRELRAVRVYEGVRLERTDNESVRRIDETAPETLAELSWEIPVPGTLECPFGIFEAKIFPYKNQKIEEKKCTKWFDYDKIKTGPCVRTRRQGDFLVVNREGGRKKLNRIFIDEKIPAELRDQIPVIAVGEEILWIPGGRMNEQYKIASTTGRVLELHYQGGVLT